MTKKTATPKFFCGCGYGSGKKGPLTIHKKSCDSLPDKGTLNNIVSQFPALRIRDISSVLYGGVEDYYLYGILGWSKRKIKKRKRATLKLKRQIGATNYSVKGPDEYYRARCLRCEILLRSGQEISLRLCLYCQEENPDHGLIIDRVSFLDNISYIETSSNQGMVTAGWDGTMMTYFAYVNLGGSVMWATGNVPYQVKTLEALDTCMSDMGINEHKIIKEIVGDLPKYTNKEIAQRIQRFIDSAFRDYTLRAPDEIK